MKLDSKDRICEFHFLSHDVIKYYTTTLANGTISRIPRDKYILKENAVPFIKVIINISNKRKKKIQLIIL